MAQNKFSTFIMLLKEIDMSKFQHYFYVTSHINLTMLINNKMAKKIKKESNKEIL